MATTAINLTPRDFKGKSNPDWCAGCGDFGVLNAIQRAVAEMGFRPHDIMTVSGIGCSSNLPGYINTYGMHTLHGRSLAMATGVKMANHEMNVIVTGGDGDGYGIGGNHFHHLARLHMSQGLSGFEKRHGALQPGSIQLEISHCVRHAIH